MDERGSPGIVLKGEQNYTNWRDYMQKYLVDRRLWEVVQYPSESDYKVMVYSWRNWQKENLRALRAIQMSCAPTMISHIINKTTATDALNTLAEICQRQAPALTQQEDWEVNRSDALALLKSIERSDLENTKRLLLSASRPHLMNMKIFQMTGGTLLYFAVMERNLEIVELLLIYLSEEDVKVRDTLGQTALHFAALSSGNTKIAESLIEKNTELLTIPNNDGLIPLVYACEGGNKIMAHYLYKKTTRAYLLQPENHFHAVSVLCCCVRARFFDVALDLLGRCPKLAVARCPKLAIAKWEGNTNAILSLSRQRSAFRSCCELSFWQRWIYSCLKVKQSKALPSYDDEVRLDTHEQQDLKVGKNFVVLVESKLRGLWSNLLKLFGINQIYDLMLTHVCARELLELMSKTIAALDDEEYLESLPYLIKAIITATEQGIQEFFVEIIRTNPDLFRRTGEQDLRNIFMIAVAHRQEKIFSLLYPHEAIKYEFPTFSDDEGNNMLHATRLNSQFKLERISGEALQMQRELQWFKEVESIVPVAYTDAKNYYGSTPSKAFDESHAELMKNGEQWMKGIAQSSTIVGTLIITIMFAALFIVPGGNNQDTGIPLLLNKKLFKVFIISDAISLFASSTSVLVLVGILTSRYAKDDFLTSLPKRLIIGLLALFISIATMMVAFCCVVTIMVKGQLEIVILVVVLAGIPVCVFMWLQFPLLVRITISTYGPGIFDKKMKKWL